MAISTSQIVNKIILEQELVIGPLAWNEATKVSGLRVDVKTHHVDLYGDPKEVLGRLVSQYERLFGLASREVCRDAVRPLIAQIPEDQLPSVLR